MKQTNKNMKIGKLHENKENTMSDLQSRLLKRVNHDSPEDRCLCHRKIENFNLIKNIFPVHRVLHVFVEHKIQY